MATNRPGAGGGANAVGGTNPTNISSSISSSSNSSNVISSVSGGSGSPFSLPSSEQMGIKRIWQWPIHDLKSDYNALQQRITEICGAQKIGRWAVTCELMYFKRHETTTTGTSTTTSTGTNTAGTSQKPGGGKSSNPTPTPPTSTSSTSKEMYKVRFSSRPSHTYLISPSAVLESSNGMDSYLEALQICSVRQSTTFEGDEYLCGDFILRIGSVRMGQKVSGMILEIENLSCVLVNEGAFFLLAEFAGTILAGLPIAQAALSSSRPSSNWPDFLAFNLPTPFTPRHAALMYVFAIGASKQQYALATTQSAAATTTTPVPITALITQTGPGGGGINTTAIAAAPPSSQSTQHHPTSHPQHTPHPPPSTTHAHPPSQSVPMSM